MSYWKFTTRIEPKNVSIYGLDEFPVSPNVETEEHVFVVEWALEMDVREWGIKEMGWVITNIHGEFDIVDFDEDGDELDDRQHIAFDFIRFKDKTTFDVDGIKNCRGLEPVDIEINYRTNTVVVS